MRSNVTREVIGWRKKLAESMRLHRYWNVWSYAQFQFVPVRELGRKADRRNASCDFESFVASFRGSIVTVRCYRLPPSVALCLNAVVKAVSRN